MLYEDHALVTELWKFVGPQIKNYQPGKKKENTKMRSGGGKAAWEKPHTFFYTSFLVERQEHLILCKYRRRSNKSVTTLATPSSECHTQIHWGKISPLLGCFLQLSAYKNNKTHPVQQLKEA